MVFSLPSSTKTFNRLQQKTTRHTSIFSVNGMSVEAIGQEYKDCVLYGSANSIVLLHLSAYTLQRIKQADIYEGVAVC